jgi:SEC-C motif domain protein
VDATAAHSKSKSKSRINMKTDCQCGSKLEFSNCCEPIILGTALPETAERLMRARYTAFTLADVAFLKKTLAPESQHDFDAKTTEAWAKNSKWKGLKIISTKKGTIDDTKGTVEFVATYEADGDGVDHHEVSEFRKTNDGRWLFVDGNSHTHKEGEEHHHHQIETVVRTEPKIGRNDPCHCGSGKKFKKCHG